MRSFWILALVVSLLMLTALFTPSCAEEKTTEMQTVYRESPPIMGAARKSAYLRPEGSAPFPSTAPLIVLRGTWRGMGEEYGKRAAAEIRQVFEGLLRRLEEAGFNHRALLKDIEACSSTLEEFSPEMIEFMEGIAEGASLETEKSENGTDFDAMQKIILINFFPSLYESAPGSEGAMEEEGSTWECRGTLTDGEDPLAGANVDASFYPFMYRLALVVIPDDPESNIYFTLPLAGSIGGTVGCNEEGLYVAALPVSILTSQPAAEAEPERNEGNVPSLTLPSSLLSVLTLMDSDDVDTARETLLYGPHEIGSENERGGLIPCTGMDFLVTDRETALVLERDLSHYGLREEESAGDRGAFVACTDHFSASESYGANGEASGQPMSSYGLSGQDIAGSAVRLCSLEGLFRDSGVKIDAPWLMANAAGMNYIYDEQGQKSYQINDATGQVVSCFESGLTVDRYVPHGHSPYFGTVCSVVVNTATLDVWYELGLPSDWVGPWEHISLSDFSR